MGATSDFNLVQRVTVEVKSVTPNGTLWLNSPMNYASPSISDHTLGGSGMLAIFCDLAKIDQADFRPWLMEDMFQARINIGFNACASFDRLSGDGSPYVTLYEMPSLGHLYGEPYQALRRVRNGRDAEYHRKFLVPERYTLSWTGPQLGLKINDRENGFAPYIYIDRFSLSANDIQAFNMWFIGTYLPALAQMPGVLEVRRYLAMEGSPTHFVLHELAHTEVVKSKEWESVRTESIRGTSALYGRVIDAS